MDWHTIFNIWSALKKYRLVPLDIDSCTVMPLDVDSNWFLVCLLSFWISIYCTSILTCRLLSKWPSYYKIFVEGAQKGYKIHNPSMWRRVNSFQSFTVKVWCNLYKITWTRGIHFSATKKIGFPFVENDIVLYWGPEWPNIHQMHQSNKTCCGFIGWMKSLF
jgi:hypothetical protein